MDNTILEIRGLQKTFSGFHLGPVDITVPKGAIYGLVGPNAAGKTTTIDLIMGMGKEDAGTITVFGLDHRMEEVAVKSRIGYVSPELNYTPWRRVKRLIHFIRQFYPTWDNEYCYHLLEKLGVGWDDKIATMSFGTRIKLSVILALSHHPDLLLLDEPTIGIDAVSKSEIYSELLAAVQDENHTVVISSHSLSDIERFADHIGILINGKISVEGQIDEILNRYRMIDFVYDSHDRSAFFKIPGFYIQQQSGNRCRAVADMSNGLAEKLQTMGVQEIAAGPITLEELFIALAKNK